MDVTLLSRIQFSLTSMFHYIYPPLSIGLGLMMVILEGTYLKTKNPLYKQAAKFFIKVFSLTFALGVATGLVQVFGFGTNWSRFSQFVGDVFGSALAAEGIFAFFLEAGFLGVVLFGWDKVRPGIHFLSTVLVSFGAHFSAVWIVAANSWMQTPAGYKIIGEGSKTRAIVENFWTMILNSSSLDRITHVVIGCWLAGAFLVLSISAYYYSKRIHLPMARISMKIGLVVAFICLILQLFSGDSTAIGVSKNQPAKLAAIEGIYKTEPYTPMTVVGWVDSVNQTAKGLQIPGFLSFLVYRNFQTPVPGLDQIPKEDWPPVSIVFHTYHIMVAMWVIMFVLTIVALILWKRGKLENSKWTLRALMFSVIFPQIANEVGWMTAEIGRQPWLVYGVMRTAEGISPAIDAGQVLGSIIMFVIIYLLLFALFLFLLDKKIKEGPEGEVTKIFQDPFKELDKKKR